MEQRRVEKPLHWMGTSKRDLRRFSDEARHEAGFDLDRVQIGSQPRNWKPMDSIGPGVSEIRVRTNEGGNQEHRVVYVARFAEAVYVLHAFEKKSQKTSQHDLDVARARYAEMIRLRASSQRRQ